MTVFDNITTISGVHDFLEGNLCSTLFSSDASHFGYLNSYNKVMGGVRVRSQQYEFGTCTLRESESKFGVETSHTFPCWSGDSKTEYGPCTTLAGITSCEFRYYTASENGDHGFGQDWTISTDKDTYGGEGFRYEVALNATSSATEMKAFFEHLRTAEFLNRKTKVAFVEFVTFQPSLNQHLEVILIFEMNHGGIITPILHTNPFKMSRYEGFSSFSNYGRLFLMIVVYSFVASFAYVEVQQMFDENLYVTLYGKPKDDDGHTRTSLWRRPFVYIQLKLFDAWEVIHVANVCLNLTLLAFEIQFVTSDILTSYDVNTHQSTYTNLHPVAMFVQRELLISGISVCVAWMKVFKFMRLNMWLNMMTLTLGKAWSYLVGFLVVFFVVLGGFIVLGLMVFGTSTAEYASMGVSVSSIFRLILSDFDYPALRDISGDLAPVFLYGYAVTIVFILFNMFVAIVTDAFKDVSYVLTEFSQDGTELTLVEIIFGAWAKELVDDYNDALVEEYRQELQDKETEAQNAAEEKQAVKAARDAEGDRL